MRMDGAFVFLAAEVLANMDEDDTPLRAGPPTAQIESRRWMRAQITLRMYDPVDDCVLVAEFHNSPGGLPVLYRIERQVPTMDDREYLRQLEEHDIRPVNVHGYAYHEDRRRAFEAYARGHG